VRPDGDWVTRQARDAASWLDEMGVAPRHLVHDRDGKYPGRFGPFWKTEGVRCLRIPPRAPQANAFCECFVGRLKRECLDHLLRLGQSQPRRILAAWLRHYNTRRPHQGFGMRNMVLDKTFEPQTPGPVRCRVVVQLSKRLLFRRPRWGRSREREQHRRVPGCLRRFFFSLVSSALDTGALGFLDS